MNEPDHDTPLRWLVLAPPVSADGRGGGIVRWFAEFVRAVAARPDLEIHVRVNVDARDYVVNSLCLSPERVHAGPPAGSPIRESLALRSGLGIHSGDFDVVHGTKHLVPFRSEALRVLTIHDMTLFDRPGDFGVLKRYLLRVPYQGSIQDSDVLLCVSAATCDRLIARLPKSADRAIVTHPGMSAGLLTASESPIAELQNMRFALLVGDTSPRKNVDVVISAWRAVHDRIPDAKLLLVGPPNWSRSVPFGALMDSDARDSVAVHGTVSDAQLKWAYRHASVVLFPSLLEGYGLPAMEAVALGGPLVRSTDPAIREASRGEGVELDPADVEGWSTAIIDHFQRPRRPLPGAVRSWTQATDEIVMAVRTALSRRDAARRRSR